MSNMIDEIAVKYGTDKSSLHHHYTRYYERHLPAKTISLLEIGAFKGASLRMWKELYPDSQIACFDLFIDPDNISKEDVESLGVTAYQGNQEYVSDLEKIEGEFDVIIEDGSHRSDHQIITFETLWPKVKSGGMYVVEDLHCCYDPFYWGTVQSLEGTLLFKLKSPEYNLQLIGLGGNGVAIYEDKIAFIFKK